MAVKTYQDSKDKYLKEKVDTFVLRVPKGKKDEIMEFAKSKGMSLNGYITDLIFSDMGVETDSKPAVKTPSEKPAVKKSQPKPKAEKKPAQKPAEKPKKEVVIPQKEPVSQEADIAPAQEGEIKKKKMPSFLL